MSDRFRAGQQPIIKWTGSKRSQAMSIKSYLPTSYKTYYEPFIGGGSVLYATSPSIGVCGDICEPLIGLWEKIRDEPGSLIDSYRYKWNLLQKYGQSVYYVVRDEFNKQHNPSDLLFLSRTCVNGLIRFNGKGEFNSSFHLTRPGISPDTLAKIIYDWSDKIRDVMFYSGDYAVTTSGAREGDVVYLDPPYYNTKSLYYGTIDYDRFFDYLAELNNRNVRWLLSFDGKQGDSDYTITMPENLYRRHIYINSGLSTFKKVQGQKQEQVYESLYLNWE